MLGCATLPSAALAADECRAGFDVGSSGLRVGSNANTGEARANVDYLSDVWADNTIDVTVDATIQALLTLPTQAQIPPQCAMVAGGYSAWRLAMDKGSPAQVAATLAEIQSRSHVALFVMPQDVEGAYGYFAAKRALGERLRTPFILDMGGGSMQIANAQGGWGTALGQKAWRKLFCERVKGEAAAACSTNPVGPQARSRSAEILAQEVDAAKAVLGTAFAVTAISAPVVKAMHPVLRYLADQKK
ncbi:MAG: hypothetical protein K2X44_01435, partial [Magnetospirillum sp.]|nr:hypothetical protein [Magnetospirillum sp.]